MATHQDIANRFFAQAFTEQPRFLGTGRASDVCVGEDHNTMRYLAGPYPSLESRHVMTLAVALTTATGRQLWLFNGDTAGRPATAHQRLAREACRRSGGDRLMLFLPFSALDAAGIAADTIAPVEVLPERDITHHHAGADLDLVPPAHRTVYRDNGYQPIARGADGLYRWTTYEHFLGASVFRAAYRDPAWWRHPDSNPPLPEATFLSAFDDNEPGRSYFLCQLPAPSTVTTVIEALEALKPRQVLAAEAAGTPVLRQGDLFAIRTDRPTRAVKRSGTYTRRGADNGASGWHRNQLHDTAHTASETVVEPDGTTWARGVLRHEPALVPGRLTRPEHRQVRLGDAWHLIVRNTVPLDADGRPCAWQITGRVD